MRVIPALSREDGSEQVRILIRTKSPESPDRRANIRVLLVGAYKATQCLCKTVDRSGAYVRIADLVDHLSPSSVNAPIALVASGCFPDTRTVIRTDEAARASILASGVKLPISATNLYFAFQPQFADHLDTWISFSAEAHDCVSAAQALARTKTPAPGFVSGNRSSSTAVTGSPAHHHHPEFASLRWDLSSVRNGTMFETNGLFVLIDNDKNRTYIALRRP